MHARDARVLPEGRRIHLSRMKHAVVHDGVDRSRYRWIQVSFGFHRGGCQGEHTSLHQNVAKHKSYPGSLKALETVTSSLKTVVVGAKIIPAGLETKTCGLPQVQTDINPMDITTWSMIESDVSDRCPSCFIVAPPPPSSSPLPLTWPVVLILLLWEQEAGQHLVTSLLVHLEEEGGEGVNAVATHTDTLSHTKQFSGHNSQ